MSHISSAHRNDSGIETNLCQTAYEVIAPNWHDRKCEKCVCVCAESLSAMGQVKAAAAR